VTVSTPWLFFDHISGSFSTHPELPVRWSVSIYPDPTDPPEPDPEDEWTAICICGEINARNCPVHQ